MCEIVRACVRVWVCVCVRARVRACVRACVCVCEANLGEGAGGRAAEASDRQRRASGSGERPAGPHINSCGVGARPAEAAEGDEEVPLLRLQGRQVYPLACREGQRHPRGTTLFYLFCRCPRKDYLFCGRQVYPLACRAAGRVAGVKYVGWDGGGGDSLMDGAVGR